MRFEYGAERAFADLLRNCWKVLVHVKIKVYVKYGSKGHLKKIISNNLQGIQKTSYATDKVAQK